MEAQDEKTFTPSREAPSDADRRFGGVARVYGSRALEHFRTSRVAVIGVGGVGSWTVEALARSGVGVLVLFDPDHAAESNINRQLHALDSTLGNAKVQVL
ncbi:MAG: ThiF family adenylyltransferase, partial [Pseudomonadota bacterium]